MPKPRREPHFLVSANIRRNSKLAELGSDTARLGYFYIVLGEAKLQHPAGCFASRALWHEVAGSYAKYLSKYISTGLIEEAPGLCERCLPRWPETSPGTLIVHDWHLHQTDPGAAERAREWREGHPECEPIEPEWAGMEAGSNADQTPIKRLSRTRVRGEQEQEQESLLVREESPAHANDLTRAIQEVEKRAHRAWTYRPGSKAWDTLAADVRDFGVDEVLQTMDALGLEKPDINQLVLQTTWALHPLTRPPAASDITERKRQARALERQEAERRRRAEMDKGT